MYVGLILKWVFEKWVGGHGRDRSGSGEGQVAALVNAEMNFRVP